VTHIVQAGTGDADAIGHFQTRCWEQTYRGIASDELLDTTTAQARAARWAERIANGSRRVLMALSEDGLLLGVASTTRADQAVDGLPALELSTIYVDEQAHGTGVAARLLRAALGGEDAHLLVFSFNERAQRFYSKHGFHPTGGSQTDPATGLEEQRWVRQVLPMRLISVDERSPPSVARRDRAAASGFKPVLSGACGLAKENGCRTPNAAVRFSNGACGWA
jgi:GNAT superfamily N-acetyltransferase